MVRVGRFLLVLLFTTTLLISSQNGPKTEIAQAQNSPAIRILADNLAFTVTGAGIGSATQAKVSYQTQKVYANGIKLQNTTSTSQQFNLEVGFNTTRTNVVSSPRLIGANTGYDGCGGSREFRGILNPNETRAVPNNLACADIAYYASQTSNNLFQLAAVNYGTNSADLIIRISPAYYNNWADNFKKVSNALIWPAAKITVNDLLPNPSTYYMSLRMQDGSTRPSLQKTLFSGGGSTQYFGGAILNTPGQNNKYTVSRNGTSSSDQIALGSSFTAPDYTTFHQEAVSATKPWVKLTATPETIASGQSSILSWESGNAQTLTIGNGVGTVTAPSGNKSVSPTQTAVYVITATGPNGTATATAKVTIGLPDLVPDMSSATLVTTDQFGKSFSQPITNAVIGKQDVDCSGCKLVIRGVIIKNIGQFGFDGRSHIGAKFETKQEGYSFGIGEYLNVELGSLSLSIPAGSSQVIPDLELRGNEYSSIETILARELKMQGDNRLRLQITADLLNEVPESNETNNTLELADALSWPAAIVKAVSPSGKPIEGVRIAIDSQTSPGVIRYVISITDNKGLTMFPLLYSRNSPPEYTEIKTSATVGGVTIADPLIFNSQEARVFNLTLTTKPFINIAPVLFYDTMFVTKVITASPDNILVVDGVQAVSGTVVLADESGKEYSAEVGSDGRAVILTDNLPSTGLRLSEKTRVVGKARIDRRANTLTYTWPTREQSVENPPRFIAYQDNEVQRFLLFPPLVCERPDADVELQYCVIPDKAYDASQLLSLIQSRSAGAILGTKSFKDYPSPIKQVTVGMMVGARGFYDVGTRRFDVEVSDSFSYGLVQQTVLHENFHLMDNFYGLPSKNKLYSNSVHGQVANSTGAEAWDSISHGCAYHECPKNEYGGTPGYDSGELSDSREAFAEEMATTCYYSSEAQRRISANRQWGDHILSRLNGFVVSGSSTLPQIQAWHRQCATLSLK